MANFLNRGNSALKFSPIFHLTLLIGIMSFCVEAIAQAGVGDSSPRETARKLSQAFVKASQLIMPSVVSISVTVKEDQAPKTTPTPEVMTPLIPPEDPFKAGGLGTGVIVDFEGHIVTNYHVVGDVSEVRVRLSDGTMSEAKLVSGDPPNDLALLKISTKRIVPAHLGDSDKLEIGEWVVAAGSPFGLENTITAGIVSAKGRSLGGTAKSGDFIQTDAAINPGNSGGPLINLDGVVVGINSAIFSRSGGYMGIGFAIPINKVKGFIEKNRAGSKEQSSGEVDLR